MFAVCLIAIMGLVALVIDGGLLQAERIRVQAAADLENARIRIKELEAEELGLKVKEQEVVLGAAQVESDQIDRSLAKQRLDDTTVVSPIKGIVTSRKVEIGQIIASGVSNVGGGTAVMTISDLSRIFVVASVDESDIGRVEVGQSVVITADAFRGRRFRGKVNRKTPKGVVVSNVVTFEVKIEVLDERKALLQPEMTANVEILIAEKTDALSVATEAVTRQSKTQYVASVLKEDGTQEERPVEVGINDGFKIEVTKGLAEGDVVVVRKGAGDSAWRKGGSAKGGPPGMMFGPMGGKR
jgi:RND family efflux transporter MFP subunit